MLTVSEQVLNCCSWQWVCIKTLYTLYCGFEGDVTLTENSYHVVTSAFYKLLLTYFVNNLFICILIKVLCGVVMVPFFILYNCHSLSSSLCLYVLECVNIWCNNALRAYYIRYLIVSCNHIAQGLCSVQYNYLLHIHYEYINLV